MQQLTRAKEMSEETSKKRIDFLEKEINGIRFESEYKEGTFIFSQETWAQRFDRYVSFDAFVGTAYFQIFSVAFTKIPFFLARQLAFFGDGNSVPINDNLLFLLFGRVSGDL